MVEEKMKQPRVTVWVTPEFRTALKKKACEEGYSNMLDFTKDFAKELDTYQPKLKEKNEKFRLF